MDHQHPQELQQQDGHGAEGHAGEAKEIEMNPHASHLDDSVEVEIIEELDGSTKGGRIVITIN